MRRDARRSGLRRRRPEAASSPRKPHRRLWETVTCPNRGLRVTAGGRHPGEPPGLATLRAIQRESLCKVPGTPPSRVPAYPVGPKNDLKWTRASRPHRCRARACVDRRPPHLPRAATAAPLAPAGPSPRRPLGGSPRTVHTPPEPPSLLHGTTWKSLQPLPGPDRPVFSFRDLPRHPHNLRLCICPQPRYQ